MFFTLSFAFATLVDPMTDHTTYSARRGDMELGPGVSIECTAGPSPSWKIKVITDDKLEADFLDHALLTARFDGDAPITWFARYGRRQAELTKKTAADFVRLAEMREQVVLELRGQNGRPYRVSIALEGDGEVISRVRRECELRTLP